MQSEFLRISNGSFYKGTAVYSSDTAPEVYPMMLTVTASCGCHIEGTICWPTLGNAITKFRGDTKGRVLTIFEYEAVQGADQVSLPTEYKVEFDASLSKATGHVTEGESAEITLECLSQGSVSFVKPQQANVDVEITVGAPQNGRIHWQTHSGGLLQRGIGAVRREGSDLIITEIAAESNGPSVDPMIDTLLANALLPCNDMN